MRRRGVGLLGPERSNFPTLTGRYCVRPSLAALGEGAAV